MRGDTWELQVYNTMYTCISYLHIIIQQVVQDGVFHGILMVP